MWGQANPLGPNWIALLGRPITMAISSRSSLVPILSHSYSYPSWSCSVAALSVGQAKLKQQVELQFEL